MATNSVVNLPSFKSNVEGNPQQAAYIKMTETNTAQQGINKLGGKKKRGGGSTEVPAPPQNVYATRNEISGTLTTLATSQEQSKYDNLVTKAGGSKRTKRTRTTRTTKRTRRTKRTKRTTKRTKRTKRTRTTKRTK